MELDVKLSPKDILEREFKIDAQGYRPQEVDEYLDVIMEDYQEFTRYIRKSEREKEELREENSALKNELRKLKVEFETLSETAETGKFTSTNVDLLRRISNLEKVVYGKDE